jgi:hypothetical protein
MCATALCVCLCMHRLLVCLHCCMYSHADCCNSTRNAIVLTWVIAPFWICCQVSLKEQNLQDSSVLYILLSHTLQVIPMEELNVHLIRDNYAIS